MGGDPLSATDPSGHHPVVAIAIWGLRVAQAGFAVHSGYQTGRMLLDQCTSRTDKLIALAGMAVSAAGGAVLGKVVGKAFAAANGGSSLVHMSTKADDILASGKLGLPSNNYAGPASNASRSGWSLTARTGLSPGGSYGAVPIPAAGNAAFSKVVPIGPMTTWQRLTGQQYTAQGVMDLNSGAFTRSGVNWNQIGIYGADAVITGGAIGGGIYLWNEKI